MSVVLVCADRIASGFLIPGSPLLTPGPRTGTKYFVPPSELSPIPNCPNALSACRTPRVLD
ncbi:hypothetical protein BGY98DRAFT_1033467 [Russula aff. rugulosa BPL654]|nr:hypothetical protein BGY98DRAFT_1033467 [Russula aff. rugulosa BPL654]